jgi:sterol desaturase/sphingolipid hydroxylase (fatty acid hydroxylase superfamily)
MSRNAHQVSMRKAPTVDKEYIRISGSRHSPDSSGSFRGALTIAVYAGGNAHPARIAFMDRIHVLLAKFEAVARMLISPGSAFSVYSLATAFVLGFAILAWRRKCRRGRAEPWVVFRAIFSWRLLKNRSTKADLFYFFVNTLALGGLIGWGALSAGAVAGFFVKSLNAGLGARPPVEAIGWAWRIGATLLLYLAYEFAYWLDHYLKHKIPVLWETHKTHHTAEVLTPLTSFRVHPLDTLLFSNMVAFWVGATTGLLAYLAGTHVAEIAIDGTNLFLFFFLYATVHLQHSQFWIPLTGRLGRLVLSPAHHQIHHSINPAHYNANLGSTLAIFDWAFGTLTVPARENPRLRFGVSDAVRDPHGITELLVSPVGNCFARLLEAVGLRRPAPAPAAQTI